jgi:sec-independent protein translocase protein TatA
MGLGGISIWQLLIILVIVVVIFGTKRLNTLGSDLGGAVKGFRKAMSDSEKEEDPALIDKPDAQFSAGAGNADDKAAANSRDSKGNS